MQWYGLSPKYLKLKKTPLTYLIFKYIKTSNKFTIMSLNPIHFFFLKLNTNRRYKYLYVINPFYYFKLIIPFYIRYTYNRLNSTLKLNFVYTNNYIFLFLHYWSVMFYKFLSFFFIKLKFTGKGYYIYKNKRNLIKTQFGYSHTKYLYSYNVLVKFLTKTIILLYGIDKKQLYKLSFFFKNIKPLNIYTQRGIRFTKTIIYKKKGKVNAYSN